MTKKNERDVTRTRIRSAVVHCSRCERQIAVGEEYVYIGGFDPQQKSGFRVNRCLECNFHQTELRLGSTFRLTMYQIEEQIDEAVNTLEQTSDLNAFYTSVEPLIATLHQIGATELEKFDTSDYQRLRKLNKSRGTQVTEIADHLAMICDNAKAGRFTAEQVVEKAPVDLCGIA